MTSTQFLALYRAHERKLYFFVLSMTRNQAVAEDISAAAWAKAWQHRTEAQEGKAWLYQIAVNELRMLLRKQGKRTMEPIEDHLDIPEPKREDYREEWTRAAQSIAALPYRLQSVLVCAIAGLDLKRTAQVQNVPYGTAGRRLHEAREKVRTLCV